MYIIEMSLSNPCCKALLIRQINYFGIILEPRMRTSGSVPVFHSIVNKLQTQIFARSWLCLCIPPFFRVISFFRIL